MTANHHLRAILAIINSDAVLRVNESDRVTMRMPGTRDQVRATHVVYDAEGEVLGRGLDADAAIADAITCEHLRAEDTIENYRKTIRAYRDARLKLEELPA